MHIGNIIKQDLLDVLNEAFPNGDSDIEEVGSSFVIDVLNSAGESIPDDEVLVVLQEAYEKAVANKAFDDNLWRSLAEGIRAVQDAPRLRELRKETRVWQEAQRALSEPRSRKM